MQRNESNSKIVLSKLNFRVRIQYGPFGIQLVSFDCSSDRFQCVFSSDHCNPSLEERVHQWFEEYFKKQHSSIIVPLDWKEVTPFTREVLEVVAIIPFGQVQTYGQVAKILGKPKASRAVGGACGRNPFLLFIPCHRVLDSKYQLRGFSADGGLLMKQKLLNFEEAQETSKQFSVTKIH